MTSSSSSSSPPTSSSPGDEPDGTSEIREICDVRGEVCPFTFVRTKLALEALPLGTALRVLVDHEPAIRTIPRSATEWGQEVLGVHALDEPVPFVAALPGGAQGQRPRVWAIDLRKRVR